MGHLPLYGLSAETLQGKLDESFTISETNLFSKLTKLIEQKRGSELDEDIITILKTINGNCNFFKYKPSSDTDLLIFCRYLRETIDQYENLELVDSNQFEMIEAELDSQTSEDSDEKEDDDSDRDRDEGSDHADAVVEKLLRLMDVFQKLLQSPSVFGSHFDLSRKQYQRVAVSLLKLIKDENSIVAYQSSQCIGCMLQSQHKLNNS